MAKSKSETSETRLTHVNGATVSVSSDKAERLVAGGNFKPVASTRSTKSD